MVGEVRGVLERVLVLLCPGLWYNVHMSRCYVHANNSESRKGLCVKLHQIKAVLNNQKAARFFFRSTLTEKAIRLTYWYFGTYIYLKGVILFGADHVRFGDCAAAMQTARLNRPWGGWAALVLEMCQLGQDRVRHQRSLFRENEPSSRK